MQIEKSVGYVWCIDDMIFVEINMSFIKMKIQIYKKKFWLLSSLKLIGVGISKRVSKDHFLINGEACAIQIFLYANVLAFKRQVETIFL